jgi:hypothetical protein
MVLNVWKEKHIWGIEDATRNHGDGGSHAWGNVPGACENL